MWDKIFKIVQTKSSAVISLTRTLLIQNKTVSDDLWRSTQSNRGPTPGSSGTGSARTTHQRAPLHDVGNEDCRLRVVWRFYKWLYPHSAWASRVRLSNAARLDEHNYGQSA